MKKIWMCIEAAFAVTALALVVAFCIYTFRTNSEGAAAWVQAVGSIVAILASARLTRWQLAKQQKHADDSATEQIERRIQIVCQLGNEAFSLISEIRTNLRGNEEIREYFA
jgi:hypothetical protein